MKQKNILVTGGTGFIGKHLVNRLVKMNHKVTIIDNLHASKKPILPRSVSFYQGNIQDPTLIKLLKRIKPEIVFHLAADNRVTSSPKETISSNVIGTFNILNLSKLVNIKQFIFTSSAAVYGETNTFPITEKHPTQPISAYGVSKLTGELYCQLFQSSFKTSIFRFANVYGPGQSSSSEGGVMAIFINKLLNHQKPIIYGTGQQIRDFIYVDDVVDALVLSIKKPQNFILNIGSNQPTPIIKLLKLISQLLKQKPSFIKKPARPVEIEKSLFSHQLAVKTLGWRPKTSLKQGVNKTIKYFNQL